MSSLFSFGMTSSKKEKHHPNSRARRHSSGTIVVHGKKSKKDKDTDTESLSSSSTDSNVADSKKCPLRWMMAGLFDTSRTGENKQHGCPLRRVQLWHTIPLCLLAVINLLLVIIALLGLAGYRIAMGVQVILLRYANIDAEYASYAASSTGIDRASTEKD